ncbi:Alpha/Beta hydrolase fold [Rhypophila sp. PSN 637]
MRTTLVSCLLAAALSPVTLASPFLERRADVVTAEQLNEFKFFAQYAGATYCNSYNDPGQKIVCSDGVCPDVEANNVTTVASFGGPITDHRGFIAVDHTKKLIVISLRGTVSVRNWITDFITTQTPCAITKDCLLHTGFFASWLEISSAVFTHTQAAVKQFPTYRVVATGHSLGAATATIATAYLRKQANIPVDIFTFGSPRVGNSAFAKFVTSQAGAEYRVTHDADPIARLPPLIFNFRHTSPEYWLTSYTPGTSDVKFCNGHANLKCNGGTTGFNLDPHGWYFFKINGCATGETPWKKMKSRQAGEHMDMTDKEIEAMLNQWVEEDKKLAAEVKE